MLRLIQAKLFAIRHPCVEIHRIAGVGALQKLEPDGVPGGGCGSIAAEAYRVPGPVFVMPPSEGKKSSVRHWLASFQMPGFPGDVEGSLRASRRSKLSNFDHGD